MRFQLDFGIGVALLGQLVFALGDQPLLVQRCLPGDVALEVIHFDMAQLDLAAGIRQLQGSGIGPHLQERVAGPDQVWPLSIEFQIIEGRTGEVILVGDGSSLTRDGVTKTRGQTKDTRFARFGQGPWKGVAGFRSPENEVEKAHGEWNLLELIADGDKVTFKVNGKVVNQGSGAKPSRGRILFQSEGAEVFFRNIELRRLQR